MSKKYQFGEVEKTLRKNTFYLEERAKEASGLTDANEKKVTGYKLKLEQLSKQYESEKDKKKKAETLKKIEGVAEEIQQLVNNLWFTDFDKCLKVMDVLLVEGSKDLTIENFGKFDAQEVWSDFFTHPLMRGKD